jgi:hypothetical protein
MGDQRLLVTIRAGEKSASMARGRAVISQKGLFAWGVWLPAGTPVLVELSDGQHELTLFGTVTTTDADSGVALKFKETTEIKSQKLVALLVA